VRANVWAIDSEWGFRDDKVDQESAFFPVVMCAANLTSDKRVWFWGQDPALHDFFMHGANDTFIGHYAIAEMKYLLRLGVPLPERWFDTFVACRYENNAPGRLEAGLSHALQLRGLPGLGLHAKKDLQNRILRLQFDAQDAVQRQQIIDYCMSDCDACLRLYGRCDTVGMATKMAHWVEYLKAVARMELRGIPFDVDAYESFRSRKCQIKDALTAQINETAPVYKQGSFSKRSLLNWCQSAGIEWPRKTSRNTGGMYLPMDRDTLKGMGARHPFIEEVREVRKTMDSLGQRRLPIDFERRRHHFSTSVFRSVSGRNQPKDFVFSGPKWMRSLMVPESPDHVLVYVDYTAQEVGLAAALSDDENMRGIYEADDCHMAFAIKAGGAPLGATKSSHPEVRKKFKAVNLGVQYGQTEHGISQKLGIPLADAERLLESHRTTFSTFWDWLEAVVDAALARGSISTPCGWRTLVPRNSNLRTWMNWPMQATGSDLMRLTVTYMDQQRIQLLAPVHDGFLMTCRRDEVADLRTAVKVACTAAIEHVTPGFPLRWDFEVHEHRFQDADGAALWRRLHSLVARIEASERSTPRPVVLT